MYIGCLYNLNKDTYVKIFIFKIKHAQVVDLKK